MSLENEYAIKDGVKTVTKIKKLSNEDDIIFQVTDWDFYEEKVNDTKKHTIRVYGTTKDTHKKIFVKVINFQPYFYIKLPQDWNRGKIQMYLNLIRQKIEKINSDYIDALVKWEMTKHCLFHGFTNNEEFTFVKLTFDSYDAFRLYERVLSKPITNFALSQKPLKPQLFESNIIPMLRCMHIQNLETVGWVKITGKKYKHLSKKVPSYNDINIETNWTSLELAKIDQTTPFIIAAYDIECDSEDGAFPQAHRKGDRVIQIGTSFSYYGHDEPFLNSVITLKKADPVAGLDIESYDNEHEVLLAWKNLIQKVNPDFITGYNIFGFDDKYMHDRAKLLGCDKEFSVLGRLKDYKCKFIEKDLSSSAMGFNKLKYYDTNGRVRFDLMKVVQRDYRLSSYKLDNVASEFIKEKIIDIDIDECQGNSTITTGDTYGLEVGKYIKISYNDGLSDNYYKDNAKFQVIDILHHKKGNKITIKGILDGEALEFKKYKTVWAQAKDDVSPQDIFKLQRGTSSDRAKLARYCIQDCILCIKLINKLQIITNNVSMANVCSVPLSFIFLRGQGVKIFSLVSKKCRSKNYLIPVIRKPYKNDDNKKNNNQQLYKNYKSCLVNKDTSDDSEPDDSGYDGAIVFEPDPVGIHHEPVSVLDYNSLYPQSMRHRNISRETIVLNKKYDNLPGYTYTDIEYFNKNGTTSKCRYAKSKRGTPGILPSILEELLDERVKTRKMIPKENDPFKKKVLNGRQLALKVTANSLYGQCGASTSPIYMKELAASTTATGREMLNVARVFSEVIFNKIVKTIKNGNKEKYVNQINLLFNKKIDEMIGPKNIERLKNVRDNEDTDRYTCLRVFKDNSDTIDDKKFFDGKIDESLIDDKELFDAKENNEIKYETREEFIEWFYKIIEKILEEHVINPKVIYGDTDSVFIKFCIANKKTGELLTSREGLKISILMGILCSKLLHKILPFPQNMVYEKTFWPFIILSKKRYVGNLYEEDYNKYYQNSMGIVLKRRDNAQIVKVVVGGIVRSLLVDRDNQKAIRFTKSSLVKILRNDYPLEKFVISKTLKGPSMTKDERKLEMRKPKDERVYADRTSIAHAVLADRMADRDPGNKPSSNERIQYCYVVTDAKVKLQGEKIETPEYIKNNDTQVDYLFYITNQIMKPAVQFLEHITPNAQDIFNVYINKERNRRKGLRSINHYFSGTDIEDSDTSPREHHEHKILLSKKAIPKSRNN